MQAMTCERTVAARVAAALTLLALSACGGGGGGAPVQVVSTTSYDRICASGDLAPATGACSTPTHDNRPNEWTCTLDNSTGLMWTRSSVAVGSEGPPATGVCGRGGWSAPSVHELMSLVRHAQATGPLMDTTFFPGTPEAAFATRESYLEPPASDAWIVNFGTGTAGRGAVAPQVRWVSGNSWVADPSASKYRKLDDPSSSHVFFEDTQRRRIWLVPRAAPDGSTVKTWSEAAAFATSELNAKGYYNRRAWRLPTAQELDLLVVRSVAGPAMPVELRQLLQNPAAFSQTFWTSTVDRSDPSMALLVNFEYGDIAPLPKVFKAGAIYVLDGYF